MKRLSPPRIQEYLCRALRAPEIEKITAFDEAGMSIMYTQTYDLYSAFSARELALLANGLDDLLRGHLLRGSSGVKQIFSHEIHMRIKAEVGDEGMAPLLEEVTLALLVRHREVELSLMAWNDGHRTSKSWGDALFEGLAAAEDAAGVVSGTF